MAQPPCSRACSPGTPVSRCARPKMVCPGRKSSTGRAPLRDLTRSRTGAAHRETGPGGFLYARPLHYQHFQSRRRLWIKRCGLQSHYVGVRFPPPVPRAQNWATRILTTPQWSRASCSPPRQHPIPPMPGTSAVRGEQLGPVLPRRATGGGGSGALNGAPDPPAPTHTTSPPGPYAAWRTGWL